MTWPRRLQSWLKGNTWLIGAGICLLAFVGQQQLVREQLRNPLAGYTLLAWGTVAFLLAARSRTPVDDELERAGRKSSTGSTFMIHRYSVRAALIVLGLGVCLANVWWIDTRQEGESYWAVLPLWSTSLMLCLAALVPVIRRTSSAGRTRWMFLLLVSAISLFAFAVRFHKLGLVPVVMSGDEADVGRQVIAVLEGRLTNMLRTYRSYGTLEFFVLAVPVWLLGPTKFALRYLSAVGGWLAIPALAVMARRLFGVKVALVSAALLSVSHLAIQFSRVSVAASTFDPLLTSLSLYLVYRSLQTRSSFTWGLAGLTLGLSFYAYAGARIVVLVAAAFLALLVVVDRPLLRGNGRGLIAMVLGGVLGLAPMLPFILRDPQGFNYRVSQVSIFQSGYLWGAAAYRGVTTWQILGEQFRDAWLNFNYYDVGSFYEASVPMLGLLTGALFVMGFACTIAHWRDKRFLLLHLWFWIPLLVGQVMMIYPRGAAYRTLSLLPPVCIMAGIALVKLADLVVPRLARREAWITAAIVAALVWEGGWNTHYYFGVWAPRSRFSDFSTEAASLMADYMHELGPNYQTYVLATSNFRAGTWAVMDYIAKGQRYVDIDDALPAALPTVPPGQRMAFIFAPERAAELLVVESAFPGGQAMEHYLGGTLYFVTYEWPGRSASS